MAAKASAPVRVACSACWRFRVLSASSHAERVSAVIQSDAMILVCMSLPFAVETPPLEAQ
ncbi:hypothetical protein [Pararoseomonas baculiformis]|uniref:hypothetical protein n=1 Tax=Pararoseomonas baculiformis TaxID=2820812 RepID=UPI001AE0492C|nr:hypothetical protein [Pararoseomonas baculiformis]